MRMLGVLIGVMVCSITLAHAQNDPLCPIGCQAAEQGDAAPVFGGVGNGDDEQDIADLVFRNIMDRAYPNEGVIWTKLDIPVCWENPDESNEPGRAIVQAAIAESWQAASRLNFTGWEKCASNNKGIRILINDEGARVTASGRNLNGVKNGMRLNFTFQQWNPDCAQPESFRKKCIYSIAVHEFGHAIGFAHEQNRPDTPDDDCADRRQGSNGTTTELTPWDPHSVMNYCNPTYNNNGILSAFDTYAVQHYYGKPS